MSSPVTVSAAMIVRNEQSFLPGCLESLQGRVDDIVVVDTGSTDGTVDIATRAGVRLYHQPWRDDFAAARNAALAWVSGNWVLYIDADERLVLPQRGVLADYIDPDAIAGLVRLRPKTGYTRYREWRLFRSDPRLRFAGRIHETMVPAIRAISAREGLPIRQTSVRIDHVGYDGGQGHKHARNLALLEQAVRDDPDRAFLWHHLAETLIALERPQEAMAAARSGIAGARRQESDEQRAAASLCCQLLARVERQSGGDPLPAIGEGLAILPHDYALWFLLGRAALDAGRPRAALRVAQKLRAVDPDTLQDGLLAFDRRIFGDKACELAALACLRLGQRRDAAAHFAEAARLAPQELTYRLKASAVGGPAP